MATSTAGTYLMYSTDDGLTYDELCKIKDYPILGSAPNKIDTTDLSATEMTTYIFGLKDAPDFNFKANYDKTVFSTISALNDEYKFAIYMGDMTGTDGKYGWSGTVDIVIEGGAVNGVREMTVYCSASTAVAPIA